MKKLIVFLLCTHLIFNISASSDIVVEGSDRPSKVKQVLTSTPAKVIYTLLGLATGVAIGGIGWLICRRRCSSRSEFKSSYDSIEASNNGLLHTQSYSQSEQVGSDEQVAELNRLFLGNSTSIKDRFFPDGKIMYSSNLRYKHNFNLLNYNDDNSALMQLVNALEAVNEYRQRHNLKPIAVFKDKYEQDDSLFGVRFLSNEPAKSLYYKSY